MTASDFDRVSLAVARAMIAASMLDQERVQPIVGDITLQPHQLSAVSRLRSTLAEHGGAMLCDDVGLGKTYVALAVARSYESVTVIAPASLSDMWRQALSATGISAEFISIESMGRNGACDRKRSLLIIDEAHHFRNSCTRRYSALAQLCMLTPVLLLTATPLHNSRDDISSLIALFKGSPAYSMSDAEFTRLMVRRDSTMKTLERNIPIVEHAQPRTLISNESVLDTILSLPPPVPPSDGSIATRLVLHGLVRQWASSNAALVAAVKRRIARSYALLASLEAGRYPTAAELSAWVYADDSVQLAFAELLLPSATPLSALTDALRDHVRALRELLSLVRVRDDAKLADFVREVKLAHPSEKIVAFSCYAETADALYRLLKQDGNTALLTARGAMIASGPIARAEVIRQFSPTTSSRDANHQNVNMLIATDLLSEGVNLQNASVVIHLDLPWTAARIEQRIGRLARIGSVHTRVMSYSILPPPRAEAFLHEFEIVVRKSGVSAQLLGQSVTTNFPSPNPDLTMLTSVERSREILEKWHLIDRVAPPSGRKAIMAVTSVPITGALGVWIVDGEPTLLRWDGASQMTTDSQLLRNSIELVDLARDSNTDEANMTAVSSLLRAASHWYDQRRAWLAIGGTSDLKLQPGARRASRLLTRVADSAITAGAFSRRSESAALATRLRRAAATPLPLAVEWSLESLAECADEASVSTILDLVETARPSAAHERHIGIQCVAVILYDNGH